MSNVFIFIFKIAIISAIIGYGLSNRLREKYLKEREKRLKDTEDLQNENKLWEFRYNKECRRSDQIIRENMEYRKLLGYKKTSELYDDVLE